VTRFWRRTPLHRRLAEQAGLAGGLDGVAAPPAAAVSQAADPPGFDGEARGEAGIHGVPRRRQWDAVTTVEAPGLRGDAVHFVTLDADTLIVEEDEPDGALAPLAEAVERSLAPPYRAEAVRRTQTAWAVAARRVELLEARGLHGDEAELVVTRENRVLRLDGRTVLGRSPELERAGEGRGSEYVVRARRVDGDLWEVEAAAL
jgi:hypothetical protein